MRKIYRKKQDEIEIIERMADVIKLVDIETFKVEIRRKEQDLFKLKAQKEKTTVKYDADILALEQDIAACKKVVK
jgi:hypothetical protein|tara:strand:- start:1192 stop:1416 length:225 start_codon:yes stop_codon:yes gene_type:complete